MTGHATVACSLRNIETSSRSRGFARHCADGRAKICNASQPSARPRAMAFHAPPATDSCAPSSISAKNSLVHLRGSLDSGKPAAPSAAMGGRRVVSARPETIAQKKKASH